MDFRIPDQSFEAEMIEACGDCPKITTLSGIFKHPGIPSKTNLDNLNYAKNICR